MNEVENKKIIGEAAADYIKDGMTVGLGSGSTINWMLKKLGAHVHEGLNIRGIPTSKKTERLARELGIPLTDFSEIERIDLAIDGADEIDDCFALIKGGGGSLVREKIVDSAAEELIIIADETKFVNQLGAFPLPVEILPFGWQLTAKRIAEFGCHTERRSKDGNPFISDNGNYVLDCAFLKIDSPKKLHEELKSLIGVVETGLFVDMTDKVLLLRDGKVTELKEI